VSATHSFSTVSREINIRAAIAEGKELLGTRARHYVTTVTLSFIFVARLVKKNTPRRQNKGSAEHRVIMLILTKDILNLTRPKRKHFRIESDWEIMLLCEWIDRIMRSLPY